jgi:glycosyltransferase involved in cell wall biosynthesis
MTKTVLLDLTALDTEHRVRGIGRYIRDLALGLSRLPASELGGVRLLGLTQLSWNGSFRVTEDLGSYQGTSDLARLTGAQSRRWALRRALGLFRAIRSVGADVVHVLHPEMTLGMPLTRAKRVMTGYDLIPLRFPSRYLSWKDGGAFVGRIRDKLRYRSADMVVAISDASARDFVELLDLPRERVSRVYCGVDVERWSSEPSGDRAATLASFGLGAKPFVIYVGAADWRKNADGMLGGLAAARARGLDVELAWAGRLSEGTANELREAASRAGVSGALRLLGFVPDEPLSHLYRAALAHLFVSRAEGFGLTVIEAMASGCPVVTTKEGSLVEIAGAAAITVDPEDHASIGDAMVRLASDGSLRARLVRDGAERATMFTQERQARGMMEVYGRLLA